MRADDSEKSREDLLSELIAYRQWCAHLESEANTARQRESSIKSLQAALSHMVRNSSQPMAILSNHKVLEHNEAFLKKTGLERSALLSKPPTETFEEEAIETLAGPAEESEVTLIKDFTALAKKLSYQNNDAHLIIAKDN